MGDAMVNYLYHRTQDQQSQIAALRKELSACIEDIDTLRDCLADARVLRPVSFLAQLHRRRFAAARAAHPFVSSARLDDALNIDKIILTVSLHIGASTLRAVGAASQAMNGATHDIWPAAKELCEAHIYVCGGGPDDRQSLTTTARFSPGTSSWECMSPMVERRAYASAGIVAGRLYICGGSSNGVDGPLLRSMECFNASAGVARGTWEAMPPMSMARKGASAAVVAGLLYVCGGVDHEMHTLSLVERFSPQSSSWEELPPMLERRGYPASCGNGGKLYVCGGRDRGRLLSSAESFDAAGLEWLQVPSMSERRAAAAAATMAGKLYVCGGWSGGQALRSAECFNPQTFKWSAVPQMLGGRSFAAAVGATGRLYVFGGWGGGQCLNSAEMFDPVAGQWMPLPAMGERRSGVVAIVAIW